ncbi:MAG: ATP-binding protein [Candidatus Thorarchaeota archaeon]
MTDENRMVGVLVGNTGGTTLSCVLAGPYSAQRGEFLRIPHRNVESTNPSWVICRVYRISRSSPLFSESFVDSSFVDSARIFPESVTDSIIATLEIMGYISPQSGKLTQSRVPLKPGARVYKITRDIIEGVLGFNPGTSIELGRLIGYEVGADAIPVLLDVNSLVTEHLAVLAMTGAGKSYTVGRIIELLLTRANGRILIIDPHGEYGNCISGGELKTTSSSSTSDSTYKSEVDYSIDELKRISSRGGGLLAFAPDSRAAERKYGKGNFTPLRIRLDQLPEETLSTLLPEMSEPQHRVLGLALKKWFEEFPEPRNPLELVKILTNKFSELKQSVSDEIGSKSTITARSAGIVGLRLRELIEDTNIFFMGSGNPTTTEDLVGSGKDSEGIGRATIVDLMSMPNEHAQIAVSVIMSELLEKAKAKKGKIPETFTVLEEAHNFVPASGRPISKGIISRVASEGRKFGLGLCVVSQRPSKLDSDVLSQCNSFIVLRIKNPQDRSFVESVAEYASKTDLEQLPALSTGEALVFGRAFPFTVLAKIGPRAIEHGGVTPDVISSWRK